MKRASKPGALLATAILLVVWGCQGGGGPPVNAPSSTEEVTVKGTVTLDGKPVGKAHLSFDPANVNRPTAKGRSADTDEDGAFTITTLVGENMVIADKKGLLRNNTLVIVKPGEDINVDLKSGGSYAGKK